MLWSIDSCYKKGIHCPVSTDYIASSGLPSFSFFFHSGTSFQFERMLKPGYFFGGKGGDT